MEPRALELAKTLESAAVIELQSPVGIQDIRQAIFLQKKPAAEIRRVGSSSRRSGAIT
jgi:hypothetical protein